MNHSKVVYITNRLSLTSVIGSLQLDIPLTFALIYAKSVIITSQNITVETLLAKNCRTKRSYQTSSLESMGINERLKHCVLRVEHPYTFQKVGEIPGSG